MVRVGALVSLTSTVNSPLAASPAASTAEQLTAVAPSGKVLPDAGVQAAGTGPSTRSLAEAAKRTGAPSLEVASAVRLEGSFRLGGARSTTVTAKPPMAAKPARSTAEQGTGA